MLSGESSWYLRPSNNISFIDIEFSKSTKVPRCLFYPSLLLHKSFVNKIQDADMKIRYELRSNVLEGVCYVEIKFYLPIIINNRMLIIIRLYKRNFSMSMLNVICKCKYWFMYNTSRRSQLLPDIKWKTPSFLVYVAITRNLIL